MLGTKQKNVWCLCFCQFFSLQSRLEKWYAYENRIILHVFGKMISITGVSRQSRFSQFINVRML